MGATSKQSENERRTPAVERGSDLKTKQTHVTFGLRGHKRKGSERSPRPGLTEKQWTGR